MLQRILSLCRRLVGGSANTAKADNDERRVWVRFPSKAEAVVKPMNNGVDTRLSARVRNVSRGGVSLIANKAFEPGDMISVELPGGNQAESDTVLACIVHVHATADKQWTLGCTFSEELTEDELEAFGAKKERPSKPENRAWKRFGCDVKANYSLVSDATKKSWPAQVVNISAGGIGLTVHQAVEAGALLSLDLTNLGGKESRTILVCVVHVIARMGGEWVLGCNFIHELSEADMQALL